MKSYLSKIIKTVQISSSKNTNICKQKTRFCISLIMNCNVCGDQASGYFNNGGLSCSSCRVFFRRMAIKSYIKACNREGLCQITLENRTTSCKYCRYQRCLNMGMDPSIVGKSNKKRGNL